MAGLFPIIFVLVAVLGLNATAWFFIPKGPQQTTIRTGIILALTACYLMWMITYLAQMHPLIAPKRTVEH